MQLRFHHHLREHMPVVSMALARNMIIALRHQVALLFNKKLSSKAGSDLGAINQALKSNDDDEQAG